jgi:cysteine desulfurase
MQSVYLDNNASTVPDDRVIDAVAACMREVYANPSSQHRAGTQAMNFIDAAREQVANLMGSSLGRVTFTSGATEANSLAIRGLWDATRETGSSRCRIVVGETEHPSVMEAAGSLAARGADVIVAPVDRYGVVDCDALKRLVDDQTLLVSIMAGNNETGTLAPLGEIGNIASKVGAYFHTDGTQLVGRLPFSMDSSSIDLVSISAHKMHGPKGVGALLARRAVQLSPQVFGGGQERGLRSGTLNTPGIVGLGVAAELALAHMDEAGLVSRLRDRLQMGLEKLLPEVELNGHPTQRLPNTVNLRFTGADAEAVMASLEHVLCSSGSACSSAVPTPSHVLLAMGLDYGAAGESLRFSLSRFTTEDDIDTAIRDVTQAVEYVRQMVAVTGS